jgi:Tol biopolymer transport system component
MRVDVDTGDQYPLAIGDAVQPAWSPNGHRIAFWGLNDEGWRDIYTTRVDDGGDRVPVTSDVHVDYSPAWSPDGRWLYFASTRGGPLAIWRVGIDERTGEPRGDPQQVAAGGPTEPGLLSVSRDGQIVFQQALAHTRIDVADFDPAGLRMSTNRRTVVEGTRRLVDLDISPDGLWLAYRTDDAEQDIYVARMDGSGERQVTDDLAKDWRPRWSPDSTRLAFYSNASGSYQIWVVNHDGSGRTRLTDATSAATLDPVWSPDGREIMYIEAGVDSFVVRADVSFDRQTPRRVPRLQVGGRDVPFRAADWSAAAGKVAGWGVWLFSPATAAFESFVTDSPVRNPRWMSDGHRVYYRRNRRLVALDTRTRTETELNLPGVEGPDTITLSPDSRRAYIVAFSVQSDVWRLELR